MINQPSDKPNNFKEAAMSHIPLELQQSMLRQTAVSVEGMSPLEAIAKEVGKGPLPQKVEIPQQEQFITVAINDVALKVSTDPYKGALTMLLYLASILGSKDKKVAKVLKAFNFSLQDANNQVIYPSKQKGKKK